MPHRFRIDDVSITVTDGPLGDAVVSELSVSSGADEPPDLHLELQPGFVERPRTGGRTHKDARVGDRWLFVDARSSSRPTTPRGLARTVVGSVDYQFEIRGNPLSEPTRLTVFYDRTLVRSLNDPLHRLLRRHHLENRSRIEILAQKVLYDTFEPVLHQRLLARGKGFVHAAGAIRDGSATLVSGWGAAGKTSVANELIRNRGWEFLSDDFAVLSGDATAEVYPKSIPNLPYVIEDERGADDEGVVNDDPRGTDDLRATDSAEATDATLAERVGSKLQSAASDGTDPDVVHPDAYYGLPDDHPRPYPVSKVVHLLRVEGDEFEAEAVSARDLATRLASVLGHEFRRYAEFVRGANAARPDQWPSMEEILTRTGRLYEAAFAKCDLSLVRVPLDAHPQTVADFVAENVLDHRQHRIDSQARQ